MKQTPLYGRHKSLGAKVIDFGGWAMSVQYSGILDEHKTVREAAGIFDVSHMGEVIFRGPRAAEAVQRLVTTAVG
jgi:aminomethyltransferase